MILIYMAACPHVDAGSLLKGLDGNPRFAKVLRANQKYSSLPFLLSDNARFDILLCLRTTNTCLG